MGVAELRSTSIFPTLTLPWYSVASSSTIGAMARQGPHHVAQKSINTGLSDFNTSASKFASVTSTIPLLAIVPPRYLVPAPVSELAGRGTGNECRPSCGQSILTLDIDAAQARKVQGQAGLRSRPQVLGVSVEQLVFQGLSARKNPTRRAERH